MTEVDVLILGAGAAGLMCAIEAGRRGRRTLVLELADRPGKKILISGGGRCNFTNLHAAPENFLSANPHFAKSALARFTPQDFLALVEKHRIPWHEKTLGQLFCDRSAHDILNMLLAECADASARVQLATRILSVTRPGNRFHVETSAGPITATSLVVATGGLSIPRMGATSFGYDIARQFNHPIVETRPGLVPLVFNAQDQSDWCDLAGISAEVIATAPEAPRVRNAKPPQIAFREKMLITHRGLSGPAILQISSCWRPGEPISLNLAPGLKLPADPATLAIFAPLLQPNAGRDLAATAQVLRSIVPGRFADRWRALHARAHPADAQSRALSNSTLAEMERSLHAWHIVPAGTEGYAKAEVTTGGVDTNSLDARTMQSRIAHGLYFIGEVVDVTGWLGGYNFQWAWASGVAAGQSA
ncbi:MAG: NAD(P)/FAD-dependent oxidoreductase [Acidobacteriaceae bacterium]|jgi:predicted Rossmann fold flavoprotein